MESETPDQARSDLPVHQILRQLTLLLLLVHEVVESVVGAVGSVVEGKAVVFAVGGQVSRGWSRKSRPPMSRAGSPPGVCFGEVIDVFLKAGQFRRVALLPCPPANAAKRISPPV
jgi:hypothetical protein